MTYYKIDKMSLKEIVMNLGIPESIEDVRASYIFNAKPSIIKEFENHLKETGNDFKKVLNLFEKYEEIFDKELYVFHIAKLIEYDLIEEEKSIFLGFSYKALTRKFSEMSGNRSDMLATAKKMLSLSDVADLTIDKSTKNVIVDLSQDYIGNSAVIARRNQRTEKKLYKIQSTFGLDFILKDLFPSDIKDFIRYKNFGNVLVADIYKNAQIPNKNLEKTLDMNTNREFCRRNFEEVVRNNIQYMDLDKLLLLFAYVYYSKANLSDETYDIDELKEVIEKISLLLDDNCISMYSCRNSEKIYFQELKEKLDRINNRYIYGKYYSDIDIQSLYYKILEENEILKGYPKQLVEEMIKLNGNNLINLEKTNAKNLEYLLKNNYIDEKDIKNLLGEDLPADIIAYMLKLDIIDDTKIEEMFLNQKITEESLRNLRKVLDNKKIEEIANNEKLAKLYCENTKTREYLLYSKLYSIFRIEDKTVEENVLRTKDFIKKLGKSVDIEELLELNYQGLIPIEYIYSQENFNVMNLFTKGKIKPKIARKLFNNDVISFDMFYDLLKNPDYSDYTKLTLILSTFARSEDKVIRDNLLEYLFKKSQFEYSEQIRVDYLENNKKPNPCAIWNLFSELDENYSLRILNDGYIVSYLPNATKYIVKRIFKNNNAYIYGTAMFVFDKNVFENNEKNIINNEQIDEYYINNMYLNYNAKKIVDTGWEFTISKFNIPNKAEKYSKDQLNKINELLKQINK